MRVDIALKTSHHITSHRSNTRWRRQSQLQETDFIAVVQPDTD
jgi:hypothetical protein